MLVAGTLQSCTVLSQRICYRHDSFLTNSTTTMKDIPTEIGIVARRMKAPVPVGPPLHQVKKLIEVLEERKSTQPKFTPQRTEHWQKNYNRLAALITRLENEAP